MPMVTDEQQCLSAQQVWDNLVGLHGLMSSIHRRFLDLLSAVLDAETWRTDGAVDPEGWLVGMLGVSYQTATIWVKAAAAAPRLPRLMDAYSDGRISADRLRHLVTIADLADTSPFAADVLDRWVHQAFDTRAADPDPDPAMSRFDAELVRLGETHTTTQLARLARLMHPPDDHSADDDLRAQRMRIATDDRTGWTKGIFELYGDIGAAVKAALMAEAQTMPKNPDGTYIALDHRLAWAMHSLCVGNQPRHGDTYAQHAVVVHADAALLTDLTGAAGTAEITHGPLLAAVTLRRLACDCWLNLVADDPHGRPVGHGRDRRTASPWLRDLVRRRDGGCRFPGCRRRVWTQIHHHRQWTPHLGRTDHNNLYELCVFHHTFVHEAGWTVTGIPDGELTFTDRNGRTLTSRPQPIPAHLLNHVNDTLGPPPTIAAEPSPNPGLAPDTYDLDAHDLATLNPRPPPGPYEDDELFEIPADQAPF
ncbi:MAG: HNH endonuclease signature motif containing protein [Acidimicrobiales bacterium]